MKLSASALLISCCCFFVHTTAASAEAAVPEPFQGFDANSTYAINYDDLSALLRVAVVDVGRSNRRIPQETPEITGTRMKSKISRTANEGNRFYYETFQDNEDSKQYLRTIQQSLEDLPAEVPLRYFSRDEQLAYWLNLYNVTVLNQVIDVYPRKNLKKLFRGKKSPFAKKLLTVAGIPLSLNDIEFTILKQNYDGDPLILYGLYKGIIGGPNIRKSAYTGANVYRALKDNASEFINSNRGTFSSSASTFRVSSLYDRGSDYFPDFQKDLSRHLLSYLEGSERGALEDASKLKANINDWTVTDLSGNHQRIGGSLADSRAALMDSVKSTVPADGGGVTAAAAGYGSSSMAAKGKQLSLMRIDPGLLAMLHELDEKRSIENQRKSTVEVEELGGSAIQPAPGTTTEEPQTQ